MLVVYVGSGSLGLSLGAVAPSNVSAVWPPAGIALAALLRFGPRVWPAISLGAFLVNYATGKPLSTALLITLGNTTEALLGWALLTKGVGFRTAIDRLRDALGLIVLAALLSPLSAAVIGTLALWATGMSSPEPRALLDAFRVWWVGDAMGVLVVAPPLLTWGAREPVDRSPPRLAEAGLLGLLLLATGYVLFSYWPGGWQSPLAFLSFPFIFWAALRFGPRGAAAATFLTSALAITSTLRGHGAFASPSLAGSLLVLQLYMGTLAITGMTIAASAAERASAMRVRDDFISIASHELRTPLTSMRLRGQMLERMIRRDARAPAGQDRLLASLSSLNRQIDRLALLVDDLLDISRLDAKRLTMRFEEVRLVDLVRSVVDQLQGDAERAGCDVELLAQAEPVGRWDRRRLEQVVTNLLGNALKYGEGRPIAIAVEGNEREASIAVRDHGIGITKDAQRRIFDRFERAVSTRNFGGFGLGLYIVRQVVEAHGGHIDVHSEPGAGSTFRVELPLRPPGPHA